MTKKVLFISKPVLPPWTDSNKRLVYELINNFSNTECYIYSSINFGKKNIKPFGLPQKDFQYDPTIGSKIRMLLKIIIIQKNMDLVHYFFTPNPLTSKIMKILKIFSKKKILHNICSINSAVRYWEKLLCADMNICLSDTTKQYLLDRNIKNIVRIYPGIKVSADLYKKSVSDNFFIKKYNLYKKKMILFPGDYSRSWKHEVIINALKNLNIVKNNIVFIIAGRHKNKNSLFLENEFKRKMSLEGIRENIIYLNEVSNIIELIQASHIVIFPVDDLTKKMDIPIILLEALSQGKPVIISNFAPLNEIFKDEVGLLISKGSIDELTDGINKLLNDKEFYLKCSKNCLQVADKYFNINKVALEYEKIYREL